MDLVGRQHNNTAEEVFSMWSAPRLFARQLSGNTPLQQYYKTVFFHGVRPEAI
jgi:hypothetical protein